MAKRLLVGISVFAASVVVAAPPPPPGGGPGCWPPPCVPVDGGLVFLMLAGGLYAIKKIYDFRKQKALQ